MSSTTFTIQELKKLDRINATIMDFLGFPRWTIATGSMLISGVQPSPLATKIPDEGSQLLNLTLSASANQLRTARYVMEDWSECHEDDKGCRLAVPSDEEPIGFLIWCEEEYRNSLRRPELLDHFLSLAGFQDARPMRQDIIARLLELEQHATVEKNRLTSIGSETSSRQDDRSRPDYFAKRITKLVDSGQIISPIAREIGVALDKTSFTGIRQPIRVWRCLLDMAQSGQFEVLKSTGPDTLQIPSGKRLWVPYTVQRLGQFLRRNAKLLLDEEGNSS